MKTTVLAATLFASVLAFGAVAPAFAGEHGDKPTKAKPAGASHKAVTMSGEMVCAKCTLHETDKCQNVLKVTEEGKETKYYLAENATAKKNHEQVCSGPAKATVTGTVKEASGKKVLTASNIKYE